MTPFTYMSYTRVWDEGALSAYACTCMKVHAAKSIFDWALPQNEEKKMSGTSGKIISMK